MNFSIHINSDPLEEELLFVKQLGIQYVYTSIKRDRLDLDYLNNLKTKVDKHGLTLFRVMHGSLGKCDEIILALPERDKRIDEYIQFLEMLKQTEIPVTTFTWEADRVWRSDPGETRECVTGFVDLAQLKTHPNTHGRKYSRNEIWDNYQYFIEKVIPAAESCDVKLLLHPNDPPTDALGGIPCLINSRDDYKKAFELGKSRYLGMEFCCGCWLEGGDAFGNVLDDLKYFIGEGRVSIIHFRNVSSPLPVFTETFLDNGYMDMYKIMRLLVELKYDGTITLDHTPKFTDWAGGKAAASAYAYGYMRALQNRALNEICS